MRQGSVHRYREYRSTFDHLTNVRISDEICELIYRIFLVILLVALEQKSEEDETKLEQEQIEWSYTIALVIILIVLGLIAVIAVTHGMSRDSNEYEIALIVFMCWLIICFIVLFSQIMKGVNIYYGNSFKRKIFVFDPEKNETKTIMDDGTYIIKDGRIVGRQDLD